ncbi:hypothetical protein A3F37_02420 [Candidatus Saccharibacteria bacterium RIFCSPHIGHO2_12_FULL_41_12]|nr:MAG: hypothetical protein A3F37_02420 [Candidatus Saccharibacteria bacterium RIFCSPHIGHO2_12_FULL_41_12]
MRVINNKEWAKKNRKKIAEKIISASGAVPVDKPIAIFMAGIPGAGKTEFLEQFLASSPDPFVKIDLDTIVEYFENYSADKYYMYRDSANPIIEKTLDIVTEKKYNFALDGTFAHSKGAHNIQRALNHGYFVGLFYIYQDPLVAWDITKAREIDTKRGIERKGFLKACEEVPNNVQKIIDDLGDKVYVVSVVKDNLNRYSFNRGAKRVDDFGKRTYNKDELNRKII